MGRSITAWALAMFIGISAPAAAEAQGRPGARKLRDVERGVWAAAQAGAVVFFDLPGESAGTAAGSLIGIEVGVDLGRDFQIGLMGWGQSVGAPADYKGITDDSIDPKRARGDFQSMLLGGSMRWSFLRLADENAVDRTFFYVRGGGGATVSRPVGILDEQGIFVMGGLGVEYFTRLRHFSVGAEFGWLGMFGDLGEAHAVTVLPQLKYTF